MSLGFKVRGSEFLHSQGTSVPIHGYSTNSSAIFKLGQAINGQDLATSYPTMAAAVDGVGEALGELITTISELYEEHVPAMSVRMKYNKPNDLVDLQRGEKVATITSLQGLHVTVEELSKKLERFKVRTVTVGGVIVKEQTSQQTCIEIDSPCSRWFIHSA